MTGFLARLTRFATPSAPSGSSDTPQRVALLDELRRRIDRMERRPVEPVPRLPPGPFVDTRPRAHAPGGRARLATIAGATVRPFGVSVHASIGAQDKIGAVAPVDAMIGSPQVAAPLAGLEAAPPDLLHGLRILDVETTGLSGGTGTLAFLVGVARFAGDGTLEMEQLVLGSPADEPGQLDRLLELLDGGTLLVSFNGRAFDVPLLRTRLILSRRPVAPLTRLPHLDLLPVARRLWRMRAGDCRLVTLEERVLGRRRPDDVPGSMAPLAYTTYLQCGDVGPLAGIVAHNRDDLAGTAALLAAALRTLEDPLTWAEDASELVAVAEHRLRLGQDPDPLPLLDRAIELARAPETRRRALTQLARVHRRAGRIDAARGAWDRYRRDFPRENLGYVELAKLLEHRARDPAGALAVVCEAPHPALLDVQHRISRLSRRLERSARTQTP